MRGAAGGVLDDTQDKIDDAADAVREDAEDAIGEGSAVALAEALRAALEAKEATDSNISLVDVDVINDTIGDLPGDADFTGVEDSDGDGKDDDGKVQANVNEHAACLRIEPDGNTNVDRGVRELVAVVSLDHGSSSARSCEFAALTAACDALAAPPLQVVEGSAPTGVHNPHNRAGRARPPGSRFVARRRSPLLRVRCAHRRV